MVHFFILVSLAKLRRLVPPSPLLQGSYLPQTPKQELSNVMYWPDREGMGFDLPCDELADSRAQSSSKADRTVSEKHEEDE